jgi:hypothetical protein
MAFAEELFDLVPWQDFRSIYPEKVKEDYKKKGG